MEDDFRNLTSKVWANLDNPITRYDLSKVSLNRVCRPLRCNIIIHVTSQQYNCVTELYTNCIKKILFINCIFPLFLYLGTLGLS